MYKRQPLNAAVRTLNVPNVSSCVRLFALAALCFIQAAFLAARFLRRFFERVPSAVRSIPGLYLGSYGGPFDRLGAALPPSLDFSFVDSPAY